MPLSVLYTLFVVFFFFQAEDGIRDLTVTGVQTCALPIYVLARAAVGLADDVLTALLLARTGPVLAAPAMNDAMYAHPATRTNLKMLAGRGWQFVGPETGPLAEGPSDRPGRMSEPEAILAAAERLLLQRAPWQGKSVVVTAGPPPAPPAPARARTPPSSGPLGAPHPAAPPSPGAAAPPCPG